MTLDHTLDPIEVDDDVDLTAESPDADSDDPEAELSAESDDEQPEEPIEAPEETPASEEPQNCDEDGQELALAEAVLELEALRAQKRYETRRLNAAIEEKLDQVVLLARRRHDRQMKILFPVGTVMQDWPADGETALAVPDEGADSETPSEETSEEDAPDVPDAEEDCGAVPFGESEAAA